MNHSRNSWYLSAILIQTDFLVRLEKSEIFQFKTKNKMHLKNIESWFRDEISGLPVLNIFFSIRLIWHDFLHSLLNLTRLDKGRRRIKEEEEINMIMESIVLHNKKSCIHRMFIRPTIQVRILSLYCAKLNDSRW